MSDWQKRPPRNSDDDDERPRRRDDEDDEPERDDRPRFGSRRRRRTDDDEFDEMPEGRAYVHDKCGGVTVVSGGDFTHICDPFRICTGTYCCTCQGFAPLEQVRWVDTDEVVADYRARLKEGTPEALKVWRSGVGCAVGLVFGLLVGLLIYLVAKPRGHIAWFLGVAGSLIVAIVGSLILEAKYKIDYRRKR